MFQRVQEIDELKIHLQEMRTGGQTLLFLLHTDV